MKYIICGILCLLLCAPCALAQQMPQLLEPVGVQLNAAEAFIGDISNIDVFEGSVVPYVEEFYFEQEGVIDVMHVVAGQMVKAGDPLITLDTDASEKRIRTLRRQLEQLNRNGEYEDAILQLDLDMLALELRALKRQNPRDESAVMLKQLDIEEKKLEMAHAQELRQLESRQLQSELDVLEKEIVKNVLYAPFDGRVMYMTAQWQHGSYVSAYTPLIYLADDTRLFVESTYIMSALLQSAHDVYAHIGSNRYQLTPLPIDEQEYLSKVLSGETLMLPFAINQPDDTLCAGQYAAVCVETNYLADALLVPTNTLYSDGERYLYVMEDGVRVRREVKTGVATDWYTQITEGLEEGELVYVKE